MPTESFLGAGVLRRHGWIGIRLDLEQPDWDLVAGFVRDAWVLAAPKRLRSALQEAG